MDSDAPTPNSIGAVLRDLKRHTNEGQATNKDDALAEIATMPGWKQLKEYIDARIAYLGDMVKGDMTDLQAVGLKAIVSDLVKDELRGIVQKVEKTKEAVDDAKVKKKK